MNQCSQICALVVLLGLLITFLTSDQDTIKSRSSSHTVGDPRVQFLLATHKLGTVDVWMNDALVATSIAFGQVSGYLPIKHRDEYHLELNSHGHKVHKNDRMLLSRYDCQDLGKATIAVPLNAWVCL